MKHITKNNGAVEPFNPKKLNNSIKRALISNHVSNETALRVADTVTAKVVDWLSNKTIVTYKDLRHQTTKFLAEYDKNSAMLYKKYKDLW